MDRSIKSNRVCRCAYTSLNPLIQKVKSKMTTWASKSLSYAGRLQLLKLRDIIYPMIKLEVGNGRDCSFWTSNWTPYGALNVYLDDVNTAAVGISARTTLSDLWSNGNWILPAARSEKHLQIISYLSTLSLSNNPDKFVWSLNGVIRCRARQHAEIIEYIRQLPLPDENNGPDMYLWRHAPHRFRPFFSSARTWDQIRHRRVVTPWAKLGGSNKPYLGVASFCGLLSAIDSPRETECEFGASHNLVFYAGKGTKQEIIYFSLVRTLTLFGLKLATLCGDIT